MHPVRNHKDPSAENPASTFPRPNKRPWHALWILAALVAFPQHAWANAGTPLMWATFLHLWVGNALIGLLEGLLLAWWFPIPKRHGILIMIAANYASAWVGGQFLGGRIVESLPMDLTNGWRWFWILVCATYVMTVFLEWPFVAWYLRGSPGLWKRSLRASLVVQKLGVLDGRLAG